MRLLNGWTAALLMAPLVGVLAAGTAADAQRPRTPAPSDDVLLKDYHPHSQLKVESHLVERARFPLVDVHTHVDKDDPERLIGVMDACNVIQVVNLNGWFGQRLHDIIKRFAAYPGRVIHYARVDWSRLDEPDFSQYAARQLEEDVKSGARGLKIPKDLGISIRDHTSHLIAVNDPRLDAVWAKAGELGIPVAIHTSDPTAFFEPIDASNERYLQLLQFPQWSYFGTDVPPKAVLLSQRNDVIARHPRTTFVGLHVGDASENLAEAGTWLDRYPNFNVEIAARFNELARQPYTARRFFLKYQDRIMVGTDRQAPDADLYRSEFRFLETFDEYFDPVPATNIWRFYGVGLPDSVLKKLYNANARRILKIPPPGHVG